MRKITIDFESFSEADLDFGAWNYAADPSTEILCMAWCEEEGDASIWIPGVTPEPPFVRNDTGDFILEAHNASFEQSIWHHICVGRLGWAPMPPERWEDSMAKCAAHALPLALDKAGAALNLTVQKDQEGKRNMQQLTKPRKPSAARPERRYLPGVCAEWDEKFELLYSYCKTDVLAERALSNAIPDLSPEERQVWLYNQRINLRGIPVDIPAVQASLHLFDEFKTWADKESHDITGGAVSSLRQLGQFKLWLCKRYPAFIPAKNVSPILEEIKKDPILRSACVTAQSMTDRKMIHSLLNHEDPSIGLLTGTWIIAYKDPDTGSSPLALNKETLSSLLKHEGLPDDVREALELRQDAGKSSVSKLSKMLYSADKKTHRVPWCFLYHGASTGRVAGRGIQPQNFAKPSTYVIEQAIRANDLQPDEDPIPYIIADLQTKTLSELVDKYESPMQAVSGCLRGFIKAPEGKELIAADYNAIEARIVLWLAGEEEALEMYRQGEDLYSAMASSIYGRSVSKKTDPKARDLGKSTILGAGFGMSATKFLLTCQKAGMDVDEKLAKKAIGSYRKKYSGVPRLWNRVGDAAVDCLLSGEDVSFGKGHFTYDKQSRFLYMVLPSGRKLAYYHPLLARVPGYDGDMKWELSFMGVDPKTKQWLRERTWGSKLVENLVQAIARDIMEGGVQRAEAAGYEIIMTVHDEVVAEVNGGFGDVKEFEQILVNHNDPVYEGLPLSAEGYRASRYKK